MPVIAPKELKKKIDRKEDIFLLDVRDQWEYDLVHLPNAKLVPLRQLPEHIAELPKDKEIITYCHHGVRSLQAAMYLRRLGYNAKSLDGGIDTWSCEVDPSLKRYGG